MVNPSDGHDHLPDTDSADEDVSTDEEAPQLYEIQAWDSEEDILDTKPGLEWWQVTFNLVVVVIGVGVMALPSLPKKGGIILSFVSLFVCGAAISESGIAMWKGTMAANAKSREVVSYEDYGRQALGQAGEYSVVIVQIFYFVGVAAGFVVLIAEALVHISGDRYEISAVIWILAPVLGLISLLPNITTISKAVPLAVLGVIVLCCIIIIKSSMDSQRWGHWSTDAQEKLHRLWPVGAMDLGSVTATLFGAYGVNGNVPSVLCEMKNPMEFPKAYRTAMGIVTTLYMLVMGCGYWGYGQFMQDDIVESMTRFPANGQEAFTVEYAQWTGPTAKALEEIVSICLFVKLMIGLPLNLMVIFYSLQTFTYTKNFVPLGTWRNKVMRLSVVALAVLIAQLVPNFGKLFALVCSIFGPLMQCFFPIWFSYKIRKAQGAPMTASGRRIFHGLILLLAFFTMTVGFIQSLKAVLEK